MDDPYEAAGEMDLCVLLVHHSRYDVDRLASASQLFFDTRGVVDVDGVQRL